MSWGTLSQKEERRALLGDIVPCGSISFWLPLHASQLAGTLRSRYSAGCPAGVCEARPWSIWVCLCAEPWVGLRGNHKDNHDLGPVI